MIPPAVRQLALGVALAVVVVNVARRFGGGGDNADFGGDGSTKTKVTDVTKGFKRSRTVLIGL